MQTKKILIIVDNPLRDLPACALLAAELAKTHRVYLTPMSQASTDIFRLNPDLVLLHYLRTTNLPLVQKLIQAGIPWSILDTEGGIFMKVEGSDETTYTMTLVKDEVVRNKVAQVFVWGKGLHKLLTDRKTYPAERILCLGTPRMDFYHPSFAAYFEPTNQARLKTGRPMILINTSFAGNNPKFSNREKETAMLVSKFGYTKEYISKLLSQFDQVLHKYIELTKYLSREFPEVDFVLRPHPFESFEIYRRELGSLPNVIVDCTDTVARWIWESQALVHYECSTALESAFAGRPTFSLSEFKDFRPVDSIRNVTDYSSSFEQMKDQLTSILNGTYVLSPSLKSNLEKVESEIYFKIDGRAYLRIAEAINQWLEKNKASKSRVSIYTHGLLQTARSAVKKVVRGYLVPEEKRLKSEDLKLVCENLSRVLKTQVRFKEISLSNSIEILRS